jgi:hypothetical protein
MYWIGDKKKALSLTRTARDIESKIHTHMIEYNFETQNIYLNEEKTIKTIYENVPIEDLMDDKYINSIIIYNNKIEQVVKETKTILVNCPVEGEVKLVKQTKTIEVEKIVLVDKNDVNEELDKIIGHHNYIPTKLKHRDYSVIRIIFEKEGRNIILSSDVNTATKNISYHDIIKLCDKHGIEFKNQTLGSLIQEIRKKRRRRITSS